MITPAHRAICSCLDPRVRVKNSTPGKVGLCLLQVCTDPLGLAINSLRSSQIFLPFSFPFPSKCRGFTCISEDSSEITFLLVENYIPDRSCWVST